MSEIVLQEGALRDLPLLDLLLLGRASKTPAIVEVTRGATTRRFYFRDATIVAFTTNNSREGLTTYLVRRKALPASVAGSVDAAASQDGLTPAQAILRDRMLPIPELARELTSWTTLLLIQAFSWIDGQFRLLAESPDQAPPETLFELTLSSAIVQGVWKRMPIEEVRALVTPYFDFQAGTGTNPAFKITDFRLPPDRLRLWEEVRRARTLRAALRSTDLAEDDALRCVYLLHRTGLIDLRPVADIEDDLADFGFDDDNEEPDLTGWLDDLGDLAADPAPEEEHIEEPPAPAPVNSPRMEMRQKPSSSSLPPQGDVGTGVDLSSIGFRRTEGDATTSSTYHVASGLREELGTASQEPEEAETQVDTEPVAPAPPMPDNPLSKLFEGMELDAPTTHTPRRPVVPPRSAGQGGWKPGRFKRTKSTSDTELTPPSAPAAAEPSDPLPPGPGPAIAEFDWVRLPTKEKDRIRGLRTMLREFEGKNYFEYFELSPETSPSLLKRAYFTMARRFHPDALVDEADDYRRHAEAIFAVISEAYEVLSEDESRDKYTRKHIHGEKDENELAMERVKELLAAEGAYRGGIRLLNQGQLGKAVDLLTEAVTKDPEEAEYRAWLGFALFRANQHADYEKALGGEEMLMAAIADKPNVAALPHLMGKIAMQRKDWGSAKKWLRKSLKMKADNPEAVREYKRIDELMKSGRSSDNGKSGLKSLFGRFGKK
jgi:curved DNA-binding protein CbpA